jgi:hypothetical protein
LDETDPERFLLQYEPLREAVRPLAELIRLNPGVTEETIRLAMVMAIHAAQRKFKYVEAPQPVTGRNMWKPEW